MSAPAKEDPGPANIVCEAPSEYEKIRTFATMHGQYYEVKMATLLYLRGINSGLEFQLATNVKGVGAFDDIFFQIMTPDNDGFTTFIQLKHLQRRGDNKIYKDTLMTSDGDFSLAKYFNSFMDINQLFVNKVNMPELFSGQFDSSYFIIFTNAVLAPWKGNFSTRNIFSPMDNYVKLSEVEASFTEESVDTFYTELMKLERQLDRPLKYSIIANEDDAKDFLRRIKLFTGQPREDALDDFNRKELEAFGKRTHVMFSTNLLYQQCLDGIKAWWQNPKGIILNQNSQILEEALKRTRVETQAIITTHGEQKVDTREDIPIKSLVPLEEKPIGALGNVSPGSFSISEVRNKCAAFNLYMKSLADVYVRDAEGRTVLMTASGEGDDLVVKYLLETFTDDRAKAEYINMHDNDGLTALGFAVKKGSCLIVSSLIESFADVTVQDKSGTTVLMTASNAGHVVIVESLLESFMDDRAKNEFVNICDDEGRSALWYATLVGRNGIVDMLVESGADVTDRDVRGSTQLIDACYRGYIDIVRCLLDSFSNDGDKAEYVNACDDDGRSALFWATLEGRGVIVDMLVASGADVTGRDMWGWTRLMDASYWGYVDIVQRLLDSFSDDGDKAEYVNACDDRGQTALKLALDRNRHDIVEILQGAI